MEPITFSCVGEPTEVLANHNQEGDRRRKPCAAVGVAQAHAGRSVRARGRFNQKR
jgi:hypothetical protein